MFIDAKVQVLLRKIALHAWLSCHYTTAFEDPTWVKLFAVKRFTTLSLCWKYQKHNWTDYEQCGYRCDIATSHACKMLCLGGQVYVPCR